MNDEARKMLTGLMNLNSKETVMLAALLGMDPNDIGVAISDLFAAFHNTQSCSEARALAFKDWVSAFVSFLNEQGDTGGKFELTFERDEEYNKSDDEKYISTMSNICDNWES